MVEHFVLTLVGPDRPGILGKITKAVREAGANWQSSKMARLAGQFAGVIEVSVPGENKDALVESIRLLNADPSQPMLISYVGAQSAGAQENAPTRRLVIDLVGNDRPGIVQELSAVLAQLDLNVSELATATEEAPIIGGTLFRMTAHIECPMDLKAEEIRAKLEKVAFDVMVEIRNFDEISRSIAIPKVGAVV